MDIFTKRPQQNATAAAATGTVNLTRGGRISLDKTSGAIIVSCGWTAKEKDYDLKACIRLRNGEVIYIGAANADEVLSILDGAVIHGGDVKEPGERETITIKWHPEIASVAISSYSALGNGRGSFNDYGVYVEIENGQQRIAIAATDASSDSTRYTLCFGEITFGEEPGALEVVNHEWYSEKKSEKRVGYRGNRLVMDIGPVGRPKN